jgi:hypothetical protein
VAEKLCPFPGEDGKRGKCIEHNCAFYVHLVGQHPQTGAHYDRLGCSISFIPLLLVENAHQTRQFAAAVETARNADRENAAAMASSTLEIANSIGEAAQAMRARAERPVATIETQRPRGLLGRLRLALKGDQA